MKEIRTTIIRVQIIAFHFTNCEVNSSYCNCNAVNHTRKAKQFLSQGKFNSSTLYFSTLHPHYILILFLNCMLLPKEILLIPKIALQCAKGALQFLKIFACSRLKALLRLACLLQSESLTVFQTLIKIMMTGGFGEVHNMTLFCTINVAQGSLHKN